MWKVVDRELSLSEILLWISSHASVLILRRPFLEVGLRSFGEFTPANISVEDQKKRNIIFDRASDSHQRIREKAIDSPLLDAL